MAIITGIERKEHRQRLLGLLARHPVVGLLGARQVGKTTLARSLFEDEAAPRPIHFFDLEHPFDRQRLADPLLALEPLHGTVVLDEVQHAPEIFEVLRVLVDRPGDRCRFLVLGSASPGLLRQSSETLAGRIIYYELPPLILTEVGARSAETLWRRGGFPRSFLADGDEHSMEWRQGFVRTFLERDMPQLGVRIAATTLRRFWTMLAHWHGQLWNAQEFARNFGVSAPTVRGYLDLLTSTLMLVQLHPWHANIAKRQVKSPKVYLADSGVLHALLNVTSQESLQGHPKVGSSWEGFALMETVRELQVGDHERYFWATHSGAELDLMIVRDERRVGFEFKRTSVPRLSPSMRHALTDLSLDALYVVYPGNTRFAMAERVQALPLTEVASVSLK